MDFLKDLEFFLFRLLAKNPLHNELYIFIKIKQRLTMKNMIKVVYTAIAMACFSTTSFADAGNFNGFYVGLSGSAMGAELEVGAGLGLGAGLGVAAGLAACLGLGVGACLGMRAGLVVGAGAGAP